MSDFEEVVLRLSLGIPSIAVDFNLFEEEIGWKGVVWGDIRPVKATVLWDVAICLLPHLHYPPSNSRPLQLRHLWWVGLAKRAACPDG